MSTDKQISDPVLPKHRSIFAILAGLIIIGFCLLFVVAIISSFFSPHLVSLGSLIGVPLILPLAWLAYKQYCALFCCEPVVARAYHEAWFVVGVFMVVGAVLNALEDVARILRDTDGLKFLSGMFVRGLVFIFIGWLLRRQTIRRQKPFVPLGQKFLADQSGDKFRLRKKMGIVFTLGCIILLSAYAIRDARQLPTVEEHLLYEQLPFKGRFPKEGSDFSYRRGFRGTIYCEFTVTEEAFRQWIASETRWEYCRPLQEDDWVYRDVFDPNVTSDDGNEPPRPIDGLYAGWGNGTGGRAFFDRSTNRAYYWTYY